MSSTYKRSRFFVDAKVQGALVARTVVYWFMCLFILAIWLVGWRVLTEPEDLLLSHLSAVWSQFGPAAIASFLLLPIVLIDIIRVSNRFAGPMLRMKRELRNVLNGERVEEVRLRDHDFWQDFAGDLSQLMAQYQELHTAANGRATPSGDKPATPAQKGISATAV